jgi:hypothetical protein
MEDFERPQPSSTLDAEPAVAASTPGQVEVALQPRRSVLQADSPLATFVRPLAVRMSVLTPENSIGMKLPPFTASAPRVGSIKTRLNEQPAEIAVASDTKLNGDTWIYLDANRNGDLTDDPHFQEGADFVAGESFAAGLDDRRDALWLQRPIRVDLDSSPPKAVVVEDRIDCINRIYLDSEFDVPGVVPAGSAPRPRFLLLDTNSDGDYGDPDGALGVWVFEPEPGAAMQVLNVAPPGLKTSFMGYRWTLSRNLSGDFVMSGQKIQSTLRDPLRVGDALPRIEATLTNGERITVGAPAKGFLLVYAWSTWYGACQRDVPFDFNDLYPKFGPRGLTMIGISTDYRKDDLISYIERNQITYPQIYNGPDLSEGALAELGINQSPIAILVDATGTVVSIGNGAADIWSFLDSNLPR